jgi:hypothetical protein
MPGDKSTVRWLLPIARIYVPRALYASAPKCQAHSPAALSVTHTQATRCDVVAICKNDSVVYARFISRWKYRFSSDQRSQAPLSSVSTGVGDQPGTLSDLAFLPPEVRGTRNSLVELATCR